MAKKFKDYYGGQGARVLGDKIAEVYPGFDKAGFVKFITKETRGLTFLARQDVYVRAFDQFLPKSFKAKIKLFTKILGPELETETGMFKEGWWLWPVGRYIEINGLTDLEESLAFIYELTKRFTGEFAIRPLLETKPKKVLAVLKKWSKDKNVHVRRLASEALRPRLPWATRNKVFKENFEASFVILDNLKNSPEKFVQKSVGNNLNDLFKEDPILAKKIITKWDKKNKTEATAWILKHGLRKQS